MIANCRTSLAFASGAGVATESTSSRTSSLLESVLDLLTGLLEVALRLVGLALDSELVIAADLAGHFLELSLCLLGGVLCLVTCCRCWFLS